MITCIKTPRASRFIPVFGPFGIFSIRDQSQIFFRSRSDALNNFNKFQTKFWYWRKIFLEPLTSPRNFIIPKLGFFFFLMTGYYKYLRIEKFLLSLIYLLGRSNLCVLYSLIWKGKTNSLVTWLDLIFVHFFCFSFSLQRDYWGVSFKKYLVGESRKICFCWYMYIYIWWYKIL